MNLVSEYLEGTCSASTQATEVVIDDGEGLEQSRIREFQIVTGKDDQIQDSLTSSRRDMELSLNSSIKD